MNILMLYSKRLAGFSLVEMAIVILIAGIMMGAGLSLLAVKQAAAQADVTQKHQEIIKQALINYLGKNKRLPCPVDPAVTPITGAEGRSATAPLPPCINYSGVVPYAELGLERAVALDGWENYIDYVVSPTPSPNGSAPTIANPYNAWLYTYNAPSPKESTDLSLSFWPSNTAGSITAGTLNIVAALISHGKNGYGAVNIKGGQNEFLTTAGIDEKLNINITPSGSIITIVKRDISDTPAGNAFDDIVMTLSANDLIGPLIANGTFQSAQATLMQANNIVIGDIFANSNLCPDTSGCAAPEHYFTIQPTDSPPTGVLDLGVKYQGFPPLSISTATASGTAYILTAGDGTQRIVLVSELRGIINHTGFQ